MNIEGLQNINQVYHNTQWVWVCELHNINKDEYGEVDHG